MTLTSAERQRFVALLKQMHTSFGPSSIAQFVQDHGLNWDHLQSSHKRLASFLRMLDSNQVGERAECRPVGRQVHQGIWADLRRCYRRGFAARSGVGTRAQSELGARAGTGTGGKAKAAQVRMADL